MINFPDGVTNRTEAIQHRLETAGLQRKIGKNQVRVVRIMLSGSPDDMKRIEQRAKEVINDNNLLKSTLNKIFDLFPHIEELLKFETFCRAVDFGTQMIRQLFNRETVSFKGEIYSHEHQRKFKTERSFAKVESNPQQPTKFRLNIDDIDSYNWFCPKEFLNTPGINQEEKKGMKI